MTKRVQMARIRPLAFKPVGSHMHTATGGGWLYVVSSEIDAPGRYRASVAGDTILARGCLTACQIAAQRRHIEAVRALLDTPVE